MIVPNVFARSVFYGMHKIRIGEDCCFEKSVCFLLYLKALVKVPPPC